MRRRHADVDERDIRAQIANARKERHRRRRPGRRPRRRSPIEQAGDSLANQWRIIGDYDAHGNSARTVVPCPGSLSTTSVASSASSRSRRPARPESAASVCTADSVVRTVTRSASAFSLEQHGCLRRRSMLDDVRERFRDDEVGGELDGVWQTIPDRSLHRDGQRRAPCERLDGRHRDRRRGGASGGFLGRARAARRSPPRPRPVRARAMSAAAASAREASRPSATESVTSRCCAPSWRLRSIRRRSASAAATIRPARRAPLRAASAPRPPGARSRARALPSPEPTPPAQARRATPDRERARRPLRLARSPP